MADKLVCCREKLLPCSVTPGEPRRQAGNTHTLPNEMRLAVMFKKLTNSSAF